MQTYHKIETIFNRDTGGSKKLIPGSWRNEIFEFLKDVQFDWTEKVDGCLRSTTKLMQTNGVPITISEVVESRLPVEIYGYADGRIVPTKVIGWHKNGVADEWYVIKYNRRGLGTKGGNHYSSICCTANHRFFVNGEYIRADNLRVGDHVTFMRDYQTLTYQQEQILTGLLIGDGSISRSAHCIDFSHKAAHEEYVDWILDSLGAIAGNKQKSRISGYGTVMIPGRTISCIQVDEFSDHFLRNGKKIIPRDINLSPISLAVIYMDDGSLNHSHGQIDRGSLSLCDYDEESVDNFVDALDKQLHINAVKYWCKGWNLRFNIEDFEKLQILIAPYVCDCMQYKLMPAYRGKFNGILSDGITESVNKVFQMEIISIEKRLEIHQRYDLTTETHNYFANGVLVHNCNIRVGWDGHAVSFGGRTERANIPADLVNKLNEYFSGDTNEEIFEQIFGEREVVLFGEGYGRKIQAVGSSYIPDGVDFILFDVMINGVYVSRSYMESIAGAFGVKCAPIVGSGTLEQAVEYVRTKPHSFIGNCTMEGVVVRPHVELCDRSGNRVIAKIKCRDFE